MRDITVVAGIIVCAAALFAVWDRWITPWLARRWALKLVNGPPLQRRSGRQPQHTIRFDAEGLEVSAVGQAGEPAAAMRWSEIVRITAFKRDWFTVDCICLAIGAEDDTTLEVNEEMDGWKEFIEALPEHIVGCRHCDTWFLDVAFPAFATSPTTVYERRVDAIGEDRH